MRRTFTNIYLYGQCSRGLLEQPALRFRKMLYWGSVKVIHLRRVLPDIVMFRFVVSMSNLVHEVEAMHCTS